MKRDPRFPHLDPAECWICGEMCVVESLNTHIVVCHPDGE